MKQVQDFRGKLFNKIISGTNQGVAKAQPPSILASGYLSFTGLSGLLLILNGLISTSHADPAQNALPQGGQVVAGQATIQQQNNSINIYQDSQRAILDWQSFDIGRDASVHFTQPGKDAIALNRVLSNQPSAIYGSLTASGQVFLLNPNGILFGSTANVSVGSFLASTKSLSDDDFLANRFNFTGSNQNAAIINQGNIQTTSGGYIALLANEIINEGSLSAPEGTVALAAAESVHLSISDDQLVSVDVEPGELDTLIENRGALVAENGQVLITTAAASRVVQQVVASREVEADSFVMDENGEIQLVASSAVVNNRGSIAAQKINIDSREVIQQGNLHAAGGEIAINADKAHFDSGVTSVANAHGKAGRIQVKTHRSLDAVAEHRFDATGRDGGEISLDAGESGRMLMSATVDASASAGTGGNVEMTGELIGLLNATVSANGTVEGGVIHIGGEWAGQGDLRLADQVMAGTGTVLTANSESGKAGEIVVWSKTLTDFHGFAQAKNAANKDETKSGRIEISSGAALNYVGRTDAGFGGQVLFDPKNIIITDTPLNGLAWAKTLTSFQGATANGLYLNNGDAFGRSLALSGDLLAIGASGDDTGGADRGAVYLFTGASGDFSTLTYNKKLASGVGAIGMPALVNSDYFGMSLALDGDHLAVGASGDDTGGSARGAVYLFNGVGSNFSSLTFNKKLANSTGATGMTALVNSDGFGTSVALDGDRLAVGVPGQDIGGTDRGAVFLFNGVGSNFSALTFNKKITSAAGATAMPALGNSDLFGTSVALDGNWLAVGATRHDTGGSDRGAVFMFNGVGSDYSALSYQAKIANATGATGMPTLANSDYFGASLAMEGGRLIVGATGKDTGGTDRGAVYLFESTATPYSSLAYRGVLNSNTSGMSLTNSDNFGNAVALDGTRLIVGAVGDDTDGVNSNRGSAYVFDNLSTGLASISLTKKIAYNQGVIAQAPQLNNSDAFGIATALQDGLLAIGAYLDDFNGADRGAVYLFSGAGTDFNNLTLNKKLASGVGAVNMPVLANSDNFGISLALQGDFLAVGSMGDDTGAVSGNRGAVYLFNGVGSNFSGLTFKTKLADSSGAAGMPALANNDNFGRSLAIDGDRLVVGAHNDDTGAVNGNRGAVYLFNGIGSDYSGLTLQKKLAHGDLSSGLPALVNNDYFGVSVALQGDLLAVGSIGNDTGGTDRGAVYLFNGVGTDYSALTFKKRLNSGAGATGMPALVNSDSFGYSLAFGGDLFFVGATGDDTGAASGNRGAVHSFTNLGSDFSSLVYGNKLASSTGAAGMPTLVNSDAFGSSIAFNNGRLVVGATGDDAGIANGNRGAAYLFMLDSSGNPVSDAVFGTNPGADSYITPDAIAQILNTGSSLQLQANNDITLASDLIINNSAGNGGDLIFRAGRSINFNADIFTDNGNFTAIANDPGAIAANRTAGTAAITFNSGASIDAGTGGVTLAVTGGNFINNSGLAAPIIASNWKIYSTNPANNVLGNLAPDNKRYNCTFAGGCLTAGTIMPVAGNSIFYSLSPTLSVSPTMGQTSIYGDVPVFSGYGLSGFVAGDSAGSIGLNGTAVFTSTGSKTSNVGVYNISYSSGLASFIGYKFSNNAAQTNEHTIVKRELLLSGLSVLDKTYDGNTNAQISSIGVLTNKANADVLTLNSAAASATFADKNVGIDKQVAISGLVLTGAKAANYTIRNSTTADISQKTVTIGSVDVADKIYDGTTNASLDNAGSVVGGVGGDNVSLLTGNLVASFDDKNVANNKTVTINGYALSGLDAGNYQLASTGTTSVASISKKTVSISGSGVADKIYDGTTAAILVDVGSIVNDIVGDDVSLLLDSVSAFFNDKNVGDNKQVSIINYALTGSDSANYQLAENTVTASAAITARTLHVDDIAVADKVYDGTAAAFLDNAGVLVNAISGDDVSLSINNLTAFFSDKNAADNKQVLINNYALSGVDATNYQLASSVSASAAIATKTLNIDGVSVADKVYDGTTAAVLLNEGKLSGSIFGDDVVLQLNNVDAIFSDKNVADNKSVVINGYTLSGIDALNYQLSSLPVVTTAHIVPKSLSIAAVNIADKVYDGTTVATFNNRGNLVNAVSGDNVSLMLTDLTASFSDKHAGSDKSVSITGYKLDGSDAKNYVIDNSIEATATIKKAPLLITADNQLIFIGDTYNGPTYDISGLQSGDEGLKSLVHLVTDVPSLQLPGKYTISLADLSLSDYLISFVPGELRVSSPPVTSGELERSMEELVRQ